MSQTRKRRNDLTFSSSIGISSNNQKPAERFSVQAWVPFDDHDLPSTTIIPALTLNAHPHIRLLPRVHARFSVFRLDRDDTGKERRLEMSAWNGSKNEVFSFSRAHLVTYEALLLSLLWWPESSTSEFNQSVNPLIEDSFQTFFFYGLLEPLAATKDGRLLFQNELRLERVFLTKPQDISTRRNSPSSLCPYNRRPPLATPCDLSSWIPASSFSSGRRYTVVRGLSKFLLRRLLRVTYILAQLHLSPRLRKNDIRNTAIFSERRPGHIRTPQVCHFGSSSSPRNLYPSFMSKRVFAHVRQPQPCLETSLRSFTCAAYDVDERCFGQLDFGFLRSNPSTGCEYKIFPHIFVAYYTLNAVSPATLSTTRYPVEGPWQFRGLQREKACAGYVEKLGYGILVQAKFLLFAKWDRRIQRQYDLIFTSTLRCRNSRVLALDGTIDLSTGN
ncbi:hypothetical protein GYMLUDRAFT_244651 [Collybiopsis luxurians FD-317 M1]|uniref:Uncharacterized protein n=1 Tax=Collybiopsis luxurians FD-317 M1 TaxID=944289 RepID=A0A0D0CCJ4_9AGAR|nr:hypothetical protein GYMLUDRAFT_244651 [Collybiopsis luxurians FD-317 M1]